MEGKGSRHKPVILKLNFKLSNKMTFGIIFGSKKIFFGLAGVPVCTNIRSFELSETNSQVTVTREAHSPRPPPGS